MSRCRPTLRTVRNRRLRHCHAPRRNGGFRHWFVYVLPPAGSSQPLASAPSCSEIRPPTRSRPRSHSPRRFGQLRPTARGRLTAALRVFRGPVLCPSPRHRPPRPPSDATLRHPLPHPSTPHPAPSLMLQRHPPSPQHLTSSPPHQAAWRRRPHPRTSR